MDELDSKIIQLMTVSYTHLDVYKRQVFFQPPAGAVCGGGVKKQVVAVKHIEYGIFFAGSLPVIRQVNKSPAGQPVRGNADIKRFNHTKSPNSSRANARPKDWYYCTAKTDL